MESKNNEHIPRYGEVERCAPYIGEISLPQSLTARVENDSFNINIASTDETALRHGYVERNPQLVDWSLDQPSEPHIAERWNRYIEAVVPKQLGR